MKSIQLSLQTVPQEVFVSFLLNDCEKHPELLSKFTPDFIREHLCYIDLNYLLYMFVRHRSYILANIDLIRELNITDLSLVISFLTYMPNDFIYHIQNLFPKFYKEFLKPY